MRKHPRSVEGLPLETNRDEYNLVRLPLTLLPMLRLPRVNQGQGEAAGAGQWVPTGMLAMWCQNAPVLSQAKN